jgi:hypothetical protein
MWWPASLSDNGRAKGPGMPRFSRSLALSAAILAAGFMAAGCGSTVKNAIGSLPVRSASASPGQGASSSPSPSASISPTPSATAPPTTEPPTTEPPTTEPPTSEPPTTEPSATGSAAAPAQPTSSPALASGSSHSSLIWLWVLLGAVVLIGVIVWIARARGRRSAAAGGWRTRVIDAYAKGSALHDAMSAAETPGALAAADAGARWSDIQRRGDDLGQTLYALREAAPDEESRARVADALASLQAVRSAMDAERSPTGAPPEQAEVVRGRLASFEAALRALRGPDQRSP